MNLIDFVSDILRGVAIGICAVLYRDPGIAMFLIAIAFLVRWILAVVATGRLLKGVAIFHKGRRRMRSLRESTKIGVPFAFSALLTVVFGGLDKAIIARMQSLSELAVYSLSYDIATKGWVLVWAINSTVLPALMRMGHAGESSKNFANICLFLYQYHRYWVGGVRAA